MEPYNLVIPNEDIILAQKSMISDLQHNLTLSELAMKKMRKDLDDVRAENEKLKMAAEVSSNQPEAVK